MKYETVEPSATAKLIIWKVKSQCDFEYFCCQVTHHVLATKRLRNIATPLKLHDCLQEMRDASIFYLRTLEHFTPVIISYGIY